MSLFSSFKSRPRSGDSKTPHLRLYDMKYCSYCNLVRKAAKRLNFRLELVDVLQNPDARRKLLNNFGRATVPVLAVITDSGEELIPESLDIIRYLEDLSKQAS